MSKRPILFIAGSGLLLIGVLAYFAFAKGGSGTTQQQVFNPQKLPTGRTVKIPTPQGNVTTTNFFLFPSSINAQGKEIMFLYSTETYEVYYMFSNNTFIISLTAPIEAYRQAAEKSLLSALKINQSDACKLQVTWSIDGSQGKTFPPNLPLSFCPGGLPLE